MAEKNEEEEQSEEKKEDLSVVLECILNKKWTGMISSLTDNEAEISFKTTEEMAIDDNGLIHSSFIMGACEYAALIVINRKNLFVQSIEAEYLAPLEVGIEYTINAIAKYQGEKKKIVLVQAFNKDIKVFDGTFSLLELDQHILDIKLNEEVE